MSMPQQVSVIVPTLDEGGVIEDLLLSMQPWRAAGHEVILVDGGSTDSTCERAAPLVDLLLQTAPGRSVQLNAGAAVASGEILWFVHADSHFRLAPRGLLPTTLPDLLVTELDFSGRDWGRFDVRIDGDHPLLPLIAWAMNLRSCLTSICTGDQAIFVRRALFERVGGFPRLPLMEDVELSRCLRQRGRCLCLRRIVTTSGRRWQRNGVLRTVWLMWRLRLTWWLGRDTTRLRRAYVHCSSPQPRKPSDPR